MLESFLLLGKLFDDSLIFEIVFLINMEKEHSCLVHWSVPLKSCLHAHAAKQFCKPRSFLKGKRRTING